MDPSQNFYSELLTGEGSTLYPSFYTEGVEEGHPIEFSQSATQQVSSQETPTTKKKKAYTRSENWTVHEDKLLVSAWLNTSQDSIQGTGQHKDKFWHRANDYFIQYTYLARQLDSSSMSSACSRCSQAYQENLVVSLPRAGVQRLH